MYDYGNHGVEQYLDYLDNKRHAKQHNTTPPKRVKKPDNFYALGNAEGPLYLTNGEGYNAYLFKQAGRAILAVGCRRYTIREANLWWGGVASVFPGDKDGLKRSARAKRMIFSIIPRAHRKAEALGWKV